MARDFNEQPTRLAHLTTRLSDAGASPYSLKRMVQLCGRSGNEAKLTTEMGNILCDCEQFVENVWRAILALCALARGILPGSFTISNPAS